MEPDTAEAGERGKRKDGWTVISTSVFEWPPGVESDSPPPCGPAYQGSIYFTARMPGWRLLSTLGSLS